MSDLLKLDNQLCFRLYSVSRKMTKAYQPLLEKYGLTYPQYIIMLAMFEERNIDFKALSIKVKLAPGTLTPILRRLEKHGFIEKIVNENDHRKVEVSLTEKGKDIEKRIKEVPETLGAQLTLSIEKYQNLIRQLDELNEILDQINE